MTAVENDPPICKTCRWYDEGWCQASAVKKFNPVRGRIPAWASEQRQLDGECGPEGKLWQAALPESVISQMIGWLLLPLAFLICAIAGCVLMH